MMQCEVVTYFESRYALLDISIQDEIWNRAAALHSTLVV
jgi:hypothetical protein